MTNIHNSTDTSNYKTTKIILDGAISSKMSKIPSNPTPSTSTQQPKQSPNQQNGKK